MLCRLVWEGRRDAIVPNPPPYLLLPDGTSPTTPILRCNALIRGDNLQVMAALQANLAGKFDLIYLDPPFFTGKEWKTRARADSGAAGPSLDLPSESRN